MKQLVLTSLLLFFFGYGNAFASQNAYDINSLRVEGDNLIIEGWAIVNRGSHNVNPEFWLHLRDDRNPRLKLISISELNPLNNIIKPSYSGPGDNSSTFFSTSLYMQYCTDRKCDESYPNMRQFHKEPVNPSVRGEIAKVIKATMTTLGSVCYSRENVERPCSNAMYVNNHFQFRIPISVLEEAFANTITPVEEMARLRVDLQVIQQVRDNVVIYGQTFNIPYLNVTFRGIAVHKNAIHPSVGNLLTTEIETNYNTATVTVGSGFVQGSSHQSVKRYSCSMDGWLDYAIDEQDEACGNTAECYPWPWLQFRAGSNYTILNRHAPEHLYIKLTPPLYKLSMYSVRVTRDYIAAPSPGNCRADDSPNNSSGLNGYLPAIWHTPSFGSWLILHQTCKPWECDRDTENKKELCPVSGPISVPLYFPNVPTLEPPSPQFCFRDCEEEFKKGFKVFENAACTIHCNEELTFTFPKQVGEIISGTGFDYPVELLGIRNCHRVYTELGSESERGVCDDWFENNNYQDIVNPVITAEVQTDKVEPVIHKYEKVSIDDEENLEVEFITSNHQRVTYKAVYNFQETFIRRHIGDLAYGDEVDDNYVSGGNKFYTDFYQPAGFYDFKIRVENAGPNVAPKADIIGREGYFNYGDIELECKYEIKNREFSSEGINFGVRQISLVDPFPARPPRYNWISETELIDEIVSKGYGLYRETPMYEITLSPQNMLEIRQDNKDHINRYSSFNLDENERSYFIHHSKFSNLFIIRE